MATSTLEVVIKGRDLLTPTLNKVESGLKGLGTTADGLKGSILAGVGLGAGITAMGAFSMAVGKATDILKDSVAAAMEDERSVARLGISLRDNVPTWDGTTKAIEAQIRSRTRLGFADDELRQSLGTLVARTHDVNAALSLTDTAMNLARFRGIDLQSAVDLLGKAWDGNIGALRRAGIAVDEHATKEQALAAVMRQTAGQAESYADTSLGRLEAAQVKINEAEERFGYTVLPLVADAANVASDAVDLLSVAVTSLTLPLQAATPNAESVAAATKNVGYNAAYAAGQVDYLTASARAAADALDAYGAVTADSAVQTKYLAINASGAVSSVDAYSGALGRLHDKAADAAAAQDRLNLSMHGLTFANTVNAQTGFTYGISGNEYQKSLNDATLAQRAWIEAQRAAAAGSGAAAGATDRQSAAVQRLIESIKRQDEAQETLFRRQIANLDRVIQKQLDAIDAARSAREEARQQAADAKDMKDAEAGLVEAQKSGSGEAILRAQERLADIRARLEEEQTRKHEDELAKRLKDTQAYIDAVAQLESSATNRKALANTLSKREQVLEAQRSAALAAGDTDTVANLDMKLEAIRAAEKRNAQAMDNAKATARVQEFVSVHTTINLDGKVLADVVDKYLYKRP